MSLCRIFEIVSISISAIEKFELCKQQPSTIGIKTGFEELDLLIQGLRPGEFTVIAGRPNAGKTALCLKIAEYVGEKEKLPVVIFSPAEDKEYLVRRMIASRARIDMERIMSGSLDDNDWRSITMAAGVIADMPIFIDDEPFQTVTKIRNELRRLREKGAHYQLMIVDYLQLLRKEQDHGEEICVGLSKLAKESNIAVIVVAEFLEQDGGKNTGWPNLNDLKRVDALLERCADRVLLLYRKAMNEQCKCPPEYCGCGIRHSAEVILAKERNGRCGKATLHFNEKYMRFENLWCG